MKTSFSPLLLLLSVQLLAQTGTPSGYYASANGLYGNDLKTALHNIIDDHTTFRYTSYFWTDTWDILKETDRDPNNPDNVILIYTGESVDADQEFNFGFGWTREHVWAKSRGDFGTDRGAGTDVHALRPLGIWTNYDRRNRWFNVCDIPSDEFGNYTCSNEWSFEPRDEVKGDVARMLFYMAVRYEGGYGEPDLELIDYIPADNSTDDPVHAKLCTMMQWHLNDPVDASEIYRNNIIYNQYQGNRNPFIDNPDFAFDIWDASCSANVTFDATNERQNIVEKDKMLLENSAVNFTVFPNPNQGQFSVQLEAPTEAPVKVELFNTLGQMVLVEDFIAINPRRYFDITHLPAGQYTIRITANSSSSSSQVLLKK